MCSAQVGHGSLMHMELAWHWTGVRIEGIPHREEENGSLA